MCFFNPYADIRFTANRLPHWQQEGAVYFVTFRLDDAVPNRLRTQWESEREHGCVFIQNLGALMLSANIVSGSRERLSAGLMPDIARVFCGVMIVERSSLRHCAISTENG
jgi:hypothetical protein